MKTKTFHISSWECVFQLSVTLINHVSWKRILTWKKTKSKTKPISDTILSKCLFESSHILICSLLEKKWIKFVLLDGMLLTTDSIYSLIIQNIHLSNAKGCLNPQCPGTISITANNSHTSMKNSELSRLQWNLLPADDLYRWKLDCRTQLVTPQFIYAKRERSPTISQRFLYVYINSFPLMDQWRRVGYMRQDDSSNCSKWWQLLNPVNCSGMEMWGWGWATQKHDFWTIKQLGK